MKRIYVLLAGLVLASVLQAQTAADSTQAWRQNWRHTNFINLYYSGGRLHIDSDKGLLVSQNKKGNFKSEGGGGFSIGRTFLIGHPIKNVLRLGIQATWCDFNFEKFSSRFDSLATNDCRVTYSKADIAVGVGPALIYQPVSRLRLKAYAQGYPAMTILSSRSHLDGEDSFDDPTTQHVTLQGILAVGANLSYRFIGLGFEGRFCTVDGFSFATLSTTKGTGSGYRAYLNFNF